MSRIIIILDNKLCIPSTTVPCSHTTGTLYIQAIAKLAIFNIYINSSRILNSQGTTVHINTGRIDRNSCMVCNKSQVMAIHINRSTAVSTFHDRCIHIHDINKIVIRRISNCWGLAISAGRNGLITLEGIVAMAIVYASPLPVLSGFLSIIVILYNLDAI